MLRVTGAFEIEDGIQIQYADGTTKEFNVRSAVAISPAEVKDKIDRAVKVGQDAVSHAIHQYLEVFMTSPLLVKMYEADTKVDTWKFHANTVEGKKLLKAAVDSVAKTGMWFGPPTSEYLPLSDPRVKEAKENGEFEEDSFAGADTIMASFNSEDPPNWWYVTAPEVAEEIVTSMSGESRSGTMAEFKAKLADIVENPLY